MLMQRKKLAKTSSTPGKTQLINHYMVNDAWYLVDLPGYGYAKMPVKEKEKLEKIISNYILERKNLVNVFVLIDSRHSPQQIDLEFMNWLGISGIPFTMVFTKADKLKKSEADSNLSRYNERMLESWEELPMQYLTSAENGSGRDELLNFIETLNSDFSQTFSQ